MGLCACRNKTSINKQRGYKKPEKGQTARLRQSDSGDKEIWKGQIKREVKEKRGVSKEMRLKKQKRGGREGKGEKK